MAAGKSPASYAGPKRERSNGGEDQGQEAQTQKARSETRARNRSDGRRVSEGGDGDRRQGVGLMSEVMEPMIHEDRLPGHESELEPKPQWQPRYPGSGRLKDKVAIVTG